MFTTYTKYEHKLEIKTGEKITTHNYDNIDMKLSNHKDNITILIIINMRWTSELDYNLLSIIFLVKKNIKMFLRKVDQLFEIIADNKVFRSANIIEN